VKSSKLGVRYMWNSCKTFSRLIHKAGHSLELVPTQARRIGPSTSGMYTSCRSFKDSGSVSLRLAHLCRSVVVTTEPSNGGFFSELGIMKGNWPLGEA
jgi:hypothetical protein